MSPSDKVVFGIHAVSRLVSARPERIGTVFLIDSRDDVAIRLIAEAAEGHGIAVERCPRQRLDALAGSGNHQGVAAAVSPARILDEAGLEDLLDARGRPFLLMLDQVQDPHNLGACLRSAEAAGADAVIIPRDRAVGVTATVRKVAAGSADFIPVARVTNLARFLRGLKARGIWCFGAAAGEGPTLYETDLTGPVCLVLGGEGPGLRRLTRVHCDALFRIPMTGGTESLNVSVAAGVCLFEAVRQRTVAGFSPPG